MSPSTMKSTPLCAKPAAPQRRIVSRFHPSGTTSSSLLPSNETDPLGSPLVPSSVPTIHNPNLKRPRPDTDDSESLPAPQHRKNESKPVWRFSGPSDDDEMAGNMRAIVSLASNAAHKDDPNPHHNIYGARAVSSVEPGQSIFTHRCDETLGKSHGRLEPLEKTCSNPSTTFTTVLETSTASPSSASSS